MSRLKSFLLVIILAIAAMPVAKAQERNGFAFNGGIGSSVIRDEDGVETFRGTAFGFSVGVEYRLKSNLAFGFGTFNLGKANDTIQSVDTELDVRGLEILARYYFPISERSELFGLIGAANYYVDIEPGGNNGLFGEDAWELGGGLDYYTGDSFSWRIEGRFYNGPRDESAGLLTVGFNYRF